MKALRYSVAVAATSRREDEQQEARRRAAAAQIRQFPDPVLKQRAREVEGFDADLEALADRMVGLMHDAHGAGLAAPQIGLLRRIFVYQAPDAEEARALVNPELVEASDERDVDGEGCLSLDVLLRVGHHVPIERPVRVRLHARDVAGNEVEIEAEGHEARILQHELDHLDGVLILDRAEGPARKEAMRVLREALDAD
jgi:peptide deformylase